MSSRIDPGRFRDGIPPSKADLRASLAAAKAELEHGGFFMPSGQGAIERAVQERLRDVVSVKDFGAVGDGVADDAPAVRIALDAASGEGKTLFFPNGIYLLRSWSPYTPPGPMFLRGERGAVIKAADAPSEAIQIDNVDLDVADLTFESFSTLFRFYPHEAAYTECILRHCRFIDVAKTLFNAPKVGGGLESLHVESCLFDGYSRAIQIQSGEVRRAVVAHNRFLNGGADSFFVGTNNEINLVTKRDFVILGNIFDGATSLEEEAHYIRCYGEYAVISNNIFANLNSEDPRSNDVEAIYPKCQHTLIANNIFFNAGVARGFISLKGNSSHSIISGNEFHVDREYIDRYPAIDVVPIFVDSPTDVVISNNQFRGFDKDIIQTGSQNVRDLKIHGNSIYDCPCKTFVDLVGAANAEIAYNSVFDGDGGGKPTTFVFVKDGGAAPSSVRITGNSIACAERAIVAAAADGRPHEIDITGNHFRTCAYVFEKASKSDLALVRLAGNRVDEATAGWWDTSSNTPLANRIEIHDNIWPLLRTVDGAMRAVQRLPLPDRVAAHVAWRALARVPDASQSGFYRIEGQYQRAEGALTPVGPALPGEALASDPAWGGLAIEVAGGSLLLEVQGAQDTTIVWSCRVTVEAI